MKKILTAIIIFVVAIIMLAGGLLIAGDAVVTAEAAAVFAQAKLKLLGNESQSVGPESAPMAVHQLLLGQNIALLEGIVLKTIMLYNEDRIKNEV